MTMKYTQAGRARQREPPHRVFTPVQKHSCRTASPFYFLLAHVTRLVRSGLPQFVLHRQETLIAGVTAHV